MIEAPFAKVFGANVLARGRLDGFDTNRGFRTAALALFRFHIHPSRV